LVLETLLKQNNKPEHIADILGRLAVLSAQNRPEMKPAIPEPLAKVAPADSNPIPETQTSRYDFDLAEFPLFRLNKLAMSEKSREPIHYEDTITGRGGQPVARAWTVHPGPFGFGGQSTQVLLFDLLQLYIEQSSRGSQIQFGTLRSLFLRRGERNPSSRDYERLRRDFDILRGYDIHCKNAFWDSAKQAYISMNWRLFESVFYFKSTPGPDGIEQPFGFIEVSSVLRAVAKTRGFFSLGFDRACFYQLKPLEQRLAIYLAKQFTSQTLHRRFVRDLAKVLPIGAARDRDVRRLLSDAAKGLLEKRLSILASFELVKSAKGEWLAQFRRGQASTETYNIPRQAAESMSPVVAELVYRISEAVGTDDDRVWWTRCVQVLGRGAIDRGLGLLKEAKQTGTVKNPGGLLTKFLKDIAAEAGVALN
jgi:hypothetical protein